MRPTIRLLATGPRTPLIKFLGKRSLPSQSPPPTSFTSLQSFPLTSLFLQEHNITPAAPPSEPHPHPESPTHSLPDSFVSYRSKAQQHGPLAGHKRPSAPPPPGAFHAYGAVGGHTGHELGDVEPAKGEVWDRSELPKRFGRMSWTAEEIEAVELGGAGAKVGWGGS